MIHVTQKRGQKCTRFTQFCEHYRIRPQFSEAQKEETKSDTRTEAVFWKEEMEMTLQSIPVISKERAISAYDTFKV